MATQTPTTARYGVKTYWLHNTYVEEFSRTINGHGYDFHRFTEPEGIVVITVTRSHDLDQPAENVHTLMIGGA